MLSPRLHCCNSVFFGLQSDEIARLRIVQHSAARLVMRKRKYDHVTPMLKHLHWLPITYRCQYKIATLVYRYFDGTLPPYLSKELSVYQAPRTLRSSNERLLRRPRVNLKSAGERSFKFSAPTVWNDLPNELRNSISLSAFKTGLKTFLFKQAFP